jgi:myo-inositol-1(or 4)-monophosphatase
MSSSIQNLLNIASEAALAGGTILMTYQGRLRDIQVKSDHPGDLVTEADKAADAAVIEVLQRHVPDHGILTEESGQIKTSARYLWAIDPLDGTTNYVHQYPFFATSVGLLIDGMPQVGAVYLPAHNELFLAAIGLGATCNHQPIRVSNKATLNQSFLGTYIGFDTAATQPRIATLSRLMAQTQGVRQMGSAAVDLAYVACGRSDAYWQWQGLSVWDMAAGIVLVREAGGQVTECNGNAHQTLTTEEILATNGGIHSALQEEIAESVYHGET